MNIPTFLPTAQSLPLQSSTKSESTAPSSGVVIEIKPGENNVSQGDRSHNTLEVNISTEAKQLSAEVTREQVFNGVEQRSKEKAVKQALGGSSFGPSPNPLLLAAAKSGDVGGNGELKDLGGALYQRKAAQAYLSVYQNGIGSVSSADSNFTSSSPINNGVELATQATNAVIKQTLFFSAIDKIA
ncbi:MAG: hypothetical protein JKX87_05840 [Cycloclasticus sp.]|nr:hypothetical protein [Cycloclasticus sp.]